MPRTEVVSSRLGSDRNLSTTRLLSDVMHICQKFAESNAIDTCPRQSRKQGKLKEKSSSLSKERRRMCGSTQRRGPCLVQAKGIKWCSEQRSEVKTVHSYQWIFRVLEPPKAVRNQRRSGPGSTILASSLAQVFESAADGRREARRNILSMASPDCKDPKSNMPNPGVSSLASLKGQTALSLSVARVSGSPGEFAWIGQSAASQTWRAVGVFRNGNKDHEVLKFNGRRFVRENRDEMRLMQ